MVAGLRMEGDVAGTGCSEVANQPVNRLHHQMNIDGRCNTMPAQRLADQRPDCEVGHIVIVHHVEVNQIGTRREHGVHFFTQTSKVRGKD